MVLSDLLACGWDWLLGQGCFIHQWTSCWRRWNGSWPLSIWTISSQFCRPQTNISIRSDMCWRFHTTWAWNWILRNTIFYKLNSISWSQCLPCARWSINTHDWHHSRLEYPTTVTEPWWWFIGLCNVSVTFCWILLHFLPLKIRSFVKVSCISLMV